METKTRILYIIEDSACYRCEHTTETHFATTIKQLAFDKFQEIKEELLADEDMFFHDFPRDDHCDYKGFPRLLCEKGDGFGDYFYLTIREVTFIDEV